MEDNQVTPLVAIDLSAAFDTVNHNLLLEVMENCFGVCDKARQWISSYLSNRSFSVHINDSESVPKTLDFSVPQGSINGPIYFTCYCSTLRFCVPEERHLAGYADDHTVYTSFVPGDAATEATTISGLSASLDDIKGWMLENRLKMNDSKTEFIICGSRSGLQKCKSTTIAVGETSVKGSPCIKLLGLNTDEQLTWKHHIGLKSRVASLSLHNLNKIRKFLTKDNKLKLVYALVFSHIDYCNGIFVNLPKASLKPFQRIQNFAAKMIVGKSKFDSATDALKELHFLPIKARCDFKILLLVYKCLHGLAPAYLRDLIKVKVPGYSTRASTQNMLVVPFTRRKTFAHRSFGVAGPRLWNGIPNDVRNSESVVVFKRKLKTYLFKRCFVRGS